MNRGLQIAALVVAVGGAGAYFLNRGRVDTSDADAKLKEWGEKDGRVISAAHDPLTMVR